MGWPYHGRSASKGFLYEIVSNKRTGIDVDKWDYFCRDCYHLGISNSFDYRRCLKFVRVIEVDGCLIIAARDKEVGTLYDMYHTRNSLHRRAYQHKTAKVIELMFVDALIHADPYIQIPGKDRCTSISGSIHDMSAYTRLNDSIFQMIQCSQMEELEQARLILRRIESRDLYHIIGQSLLAVKVDRHVAESLVEDMLSFREQAVLVSDLSTSDLVVHIVEFSYGMKNQNPLDNVWFYRKDEPDKPIRLQKDQVSQMLPEVFAEQHMRVYCRCNDPVYIEDAQRLFNVWVRNRADLVCMKSHEE